MLSQKSLLTQHLKLCQEVDVAVKLQKPAMNSTATKTCTVQGMLPLLKCMQVATLYTMLTVSAAFSFQFFRLQTVNDVVAFS